MKHSNRNLFSAYPHTRFSMELMVKFYIFIFICIIIYFESLKLGDINDIIINLFPLVKDLMLEYGPELQHESITKP
jgi:hypothetical protein